MKKSILNIISLMCCLTIMLTATSCGNNAKKEEIVVDGIITVNIWKWAYFTFRLNNRGYCFRNYGQ